MKDKMVEFLWSSAAAFAVAHVIWWCPLDEAVLFARHGIPRQPQDSWFVGYVTRKKRN
jgi:hypothetical protein